MELKRADPNQPFGGSDTPFRSAGHFGAQVPGIKHAHITQDLSIVYKVQGNQVFLYGFFTHDDLGTGSPANIRKQSSNAAQFKNQPFNE